VFDLSPTLLILLAVFLGAVLTLSGAALGALVVFRTKREPHEALFRARPEAGEAFVMDELAGEDEGEPRGPTPKKDYYDPFPKDIIAKQTDKLVAQLKTDQGTTEALGK
jgi:hypothetical protein